MTCGTFNMNSSIEKFRDFFTDGQTDAGAWDIRANMITAFIFIENKGFFIFFDTWTFIYYFHSKTWYRFIKFEYYEYSSVDRGEFTSIMNQIHHYLFDEQSIGMKIFYQSITNDF